MCHAVAFNHDGTMIVSGSFDKTIKLWDVKTGTCISTLKEHWVMSMQLHSIMMEQ